MESAVVRKARELIKSMGGRSVKIQGSSSLISEPDLIFCIEGRFFAFEAKDPDFKYRVPVYKWSDYPPEIVKWLKQGCDVSQGDTLNEWEKTGAVVGVFCTVDELRRDISNEFCYEGTVCD